MNRYQRNNKIWVCLICLVVICLIGCESKPEAPVKPKKVRQKIAQPVTAKPATSPKAAASKPATGKESGAQVASVSPEKAKSGLMEALSKEEKDVKQGGKDRLYQPEGRIDPFAPLFREEAKTVATTEGGPTDKMPVVPITPLTRVDLSQLKLTGVMLVESGNKALVEEASGKGYIVKEGMYIGNKAGTVIKIAKDTILVDEKYIDVLGKLKTKKRELQLQKPPGEF